MKFIHQVRDIKPHVSPRSHSEPICAESESIYAPSEPSCASSEPTYAPSEPLWCPKWTLKNYAPSEPLWCPKWTLKIYPPSEPKFLPKVSPSPWRSWISCRIMRARSSPTGSKTYTARCSKHSSHSLYSPNIMSPASNLHWFLPCILHLSNVPPSKLHLFFLFFLHLQFLPLFNLHFAFPFFLQLSCVPLSNLHFPIPFFCFF